MPIPRVIFYAWILSWICLIFCDICFIFGIYYYEDALSHAGVGYDTILQNLTMAGNLCTMVVCSLYFLNRGRITKLIAVVGIITSMISIILLGKRTPLLVSILTIIIYFFRFHPLTRKVRIKTIWAILGTTVIVISIFATSDIGTMFSEVWDRTIEGIKDMFSGSSNSGQAAVARYDFREWAYNYISEKFTPLNYIFGAGFMTKWLDNPVMQAYLDMGIIGLVYYCYLVIIKPTVITFSRISSNRIVFWACSLNFYNIFSAINSGHPYSHVRWIPLIVLICSIRYVKNELSTKQAVKESTLN